MVKSDDSIPEWAIEKARALVESKPEVVEALGILVTGGVDEDRAARIVMACLADGRNPVEFANHLLKLAAAFKQ